MILGPTELALIGLAAIMLSLLGYRVWMLFSGWLADRRWRNQGIDRRKNPRGRRKDD